MNIIIPDDLKTANTDPGISPEDPGTEWTAGTYNLGDEVWKATTHRRYRVVADPSTTDDPEIGVNATPATWLDVGPTNAYKMFDQQNSTQTVVADGFTLTHTGTGNPTDFINSLAFFKLEANSITISASSATAGGVFYNETLSLVDNSRIRNYFAYLFYPFRKKTALYVPAFQSYSDTVVTVTVENTGGTVKVGNLVIGENLFIGQALSGMTTPARAFNRVITDEFGNTSIEDFGNSKQVRGQVMIDGADVDYVSNVAASLLSTPIAIAVSDYTSSIVFGTLSLIPAYTPANKQTATYKIEGLK